MALPQLISILLPYGQFCEEVGEGGKHEGKSFQRVSCNRKWAFSGMEKNEEEVQKETEKKDKR